MKKTTLAAALLLSASCGHVFAQPVITGTYTSWKTALDKLRQQDTDLVFLDISMPQKTGFDLLQLVPQFKGEIIFVTAHTDYAPDAFGYNTTGYVLKPVKEKALAHAVDKALEKISLRMLAGQKAMNAPQKIAIPNNNGFDYFDPAAVLYIEATSRYTKVVTLQSIIHSTCSIGRFKELLHAHTCFYQARRSFIINLQHIKRYERQGIIIMSDNSEIPLSRSLRFEFLKMYDTGDTIHYSMFL